MKTDKSTDAKYSLGWDLTLAAILLVAIELINNFFPLFVSVDKDFLATLITIIFGILGIILTILTLFYMLEEGFKENRAIKLLKNRGLYSQIRKRFSDSIIGIFWAGIILIILLFFHSTLFGDTANVFAVWLANGIVFWCTIFSLIRIYRCINIFVNIEKIVSANES